MTGPCISITMDNSNMYKGQLKLAVCSQGNSTLQVQVIEAANLHSRWKDLCNPYIQLQICPDESSSSKLQGTTLSGTNNPYFGAAFNLPVSGVPGDKRLVISAWHRDNQKNCSEFLGCMSFGVKHLVHKARRKKVEGWYHLLSDNLGHRKHLSVDVTPPPSRPVTPSCQHPVDLSRLGGMTVGGVNLGLGVPYSVTLHHEGIGYGFTVRGSCPVRVGRVRESSPAHRAGMRRGDVILNVNAVNVTRSRAESVAVAVKKAAEVMTIDLFRRNPQCRSSSQSFASCTSSRASSLPSVDLNYALMEPSENEENIPPVRMNDSLKRNVIGASCRDIVVEHARAVSADIPSRDITHEHPSNLVVDSPKVWDHEISPIGRTDPNAKPQIKNYISVPSLGQMDENSFGPSAEPSHIEDTSWNEEIESLDDMSFVEEITTDTELPWNSGCSWLIQDRADSSENNNNNQDSLQSEDSPDSARTSFSITNRTNNSPIEPLSKPVSDLVELEQRFSEVVQAAIEAFSRPLRHCHISPRQHQRLFQNMEKMAAISSFIVKQLGQVVPAQVYSTRVSMLCESFGTYMHGLPKAHSLLRELQADDNFQRFVTLTAQDFGMKLHDVLDIPQQHLESLIIHLQAVKSSVPPTDACKLSFVISALRKIDQKCSATPSSSHTPNKRRNNGASSAALKGVADKTAAFSVLSSEQCGVSRLHETPASRRWHKMDSSVMDADIMDLQKRLTIPKHIKKFKLASTQRHFVFSGELMRIQDGCPQRLLVLLLSDLLLVTKETENNRLLLIEDPILLDQLTIEWDTKNESEFVLHMASSVGDTSLVLHTDNAQQKCVWQSILDQRISLNQKADETRAVLDVL